MSRGRLQIAADENIPAVRETFGHLGEVHCYPGRELTKAHLRDVDILLVRSVTPVSEALLAGTRVRFVGSATIGVDHIDSEYLRREGVRWASAPGCNADSVVEYVISALCRLDGALRQLLSGATVGIVGMGNVGGQLYRRLERLGIRCVAYDPLIDRRRFPILGDLESVLAADVICLHTPLTHNGPHPSYHLIGEAELARLRSGTVLINAGRGAVVDNAALYNLLQARGDICTVLDVWESEPDIDEALMKSVDLATPHIAGYSYDGKLAGTRMIYEACCRFLGEAPRARPPVEAVPEPIDLRYWHGTVDAIQEVVLAAYDIAADDQRLRGGVLHRQEESVAQVFDRLRRDYPRRREFGCYRVRVQESLPEPARRFLSGLGFYLAGE